MMRTGRYRIIDNGPGDRFDRYHPQYETTSIFGANKWRTLKSHASHGVFSRHGFATIEDARARVESERETRKPVVIETIGDTEEQP